VFSKKFVSEVVHSYWFGVWFMRDLSDVLSFERVFIGVLEFAVVGCKTTAAGNTYFQVVIKLKSRQSFFLLRDLLVAHKLRFIFIHPCFLPSKMILSCQACDSWVVLGNLPSVYGLVSPSQRSQP
jgi:hypothetical protein